MAQVAPRRAPRGPKNDAPVEAGVKFSIFEAKRLEGSLGRLRIAQDGPRDPPGPPGGPREAPRAVHFWGPKGAFFFIQKVFSRGTRWRDFKRDCKKEPPGGPQEAPGRPPRGPREAPGRPRTSSEQALKLSTS